MNKYIDNIDFFNLTVQKYYAPPNSWDTDKKKDLAIQRVFSGQWLGSLKRDGALYKFTKDEDGNMYLTGRSKSVSGEYLDKIRWVPHLQNFFDELPPGTCFIGELYLPSNEQAKSTTSIMNCLREKAIKRQETEPLKYYIFDVLAWDNMSWLNIPAEERFEALDGFSRAYPFEHVEWAKYYRGKELWDKLQDYLSNGNEGIVITDGQSLYQPGKRPSKQCMKIKKELQETIDCIVIGANPPSKLSGTKEPETWEYWYDERDNTKITAQEYWDKNHELASVAYADGEPIYPVTKAWFYNWAGSLKLGLYNEDGKIIQIGDLSGITEDIKEHWKNYVNTVVEITCMEIMDNAQGGKGLRHPKAVAFLRDKEPKECSLAQIY